MSLLVGRWTNPEGGETVEFTADGAMIVSRGGEVLVTQRYETRNDETGRGDLSLRMEGDTAEVLLEYRIDADTLSMGYGGQITVYTRVPA